jgi:hypothetical protein
MANQSKSEKNNLGKHILVVGDFMIDQAWIFSGTPIASSTAQAHNDVRPNRRLHPTWDDKRLGGAGMTLMAIRTLCQINNLDFSVHGLGIWNQKDEQLIKYLVGDDAENNGIPVLYRLKVENERDVATTIKNRFYSYLADKKPRLIARYDQELDPRKGQHPSFEKDPLPENLKENLPPNSICAVLVADFNKGAIQEKVLDALNKYLAPDCLWFVDSKNSEICNILPEEIKIHTLTINREEAVKLANELGEQLPSIPYGNQPNLELLLLIKQVSERLLQSLRKKNIEFEQLVIKLDKEGACLYNPNILDDECNLILSRPQLSLDSDGIASGDFFNASLLLSLLNCISDKSSHKEKHFVRFLNLSCSDAADWLKFKQDYWEKNIVEKERSDIVKTESFINWLKDSINQKSIFHAEVFGLEIQLKQLMKPLRYTSIVNAENDYERVINLANAKGFLGDFVSTDIYLRYEIRRFIQSIRNYTTVIGETKPLNCLIFAKPGSGKSFFVNEVASETNCEVITTDCSQIVSRQDILDSIARLLNVGQDKIPLLFLDKFHTLHEDYYPLLLEPLSDASVIIDGYPKHWRTRYVSIIATNSKDFLDGLRKQNNPNALSLLSLLSGPRLTLSEKERPSEESRTSRIYRTVQILLRYHPTARTIQRGLLDLLCVADDFNPRAIEHFITALQLSDDGAISLSKVPSEHLKHFAETLGYIVDSDLKLSTYTELFVFLGYDSRIPIKLNKLKSEQIRLICS